MINTPTSEQLSLLPSLNGTEHIPREEKIVHLHFCVDQSHWWAIEWDGQDTFFGFVLLYGESQYAEFGNFQLSELREIRLVGTCEVVNDPFWTPRAVKDIPLIQTALHHQLMQRNCSIT